MPNRNLDALGSYYSGREQYINSVEKQQEEQQREQIRQAKEQEAARKADFEYRSKNVFGLQLADSKFADPGKQAYYNTMRDKYDDLHKNLVDAPMLDAKGGVDLSNAKMHYGNYNYMDRYIAEHDDGKMTPEELKKSLAESNPEWFGDKNKSKYEDLNYTYSKEEGTEYTPTKYDKLIERQMLRRSMQKDFGAIQYTNYSPLSKVKTETTPEAKDTDSPEFKAMVQLGYGSVHDSYTIKDGKMFIDKAKLRANTATFRQNAYNILKSRNLLVDRKDGDLTLGATEQLLRRLGDYTSIWRNADPIRWVRDLPTDEMGREIWKTTVGRMADIGIGKGKFANPEDEKIGNQYVEHMRMLRQLAMMEQDAKGEGTELLAKHDPLNTGENLLASALKGLVGLANYGATATRDKIDDTAPEEIAGETTIASAFVWQLNKGLRHPVVRKQISDLAGEIHKYESFFNSKDKSDVEKADMANKWWKVAGGLSETIGGLAAYTYGAGKYDALTPLQTAVASNRLSLLAKYGDEAAEVIGKSVPASTWTRMTNALFNPNTFVSGTRIPLEAARETIAEGIKRSFAGTVTQQIAAGNFDAKDFIQRAGSNMAMEFTGQLIARPFSNMAADMYASSQTILKHGVASEAAYAEKVMAFSQYAYHAAQTFLAPVAQSPMNMFLMPKLGMGGGLDPRWVNKDGTPDMTTNLIQEGLANLFFSLGSAKSIYHHATGIHNDFLRWHGEQAKANDNLIKAVDIALPNVKFKKTDLGKTDELLAKNNSSLFSALKQIGQDANGELTVGSIIQAAKDKGIEIPEAMQKIVETIGKNVGNVKVVAGGEDLGTDIGRYNPEAHTIKISTKVAKQEDLAGFFNEKTLMNLIVHEGNHAMTVDKYKNDPVFKKAVIKHMDALVGNIMSKPEVVLDLLSKPEYASFKQRFEETIGSAIPDENGIHHLSDTGYLELMSAMLEHGSQFAEIALQLQKQVTGKTDKRLLGWIKGALGKSVKQPTYLDDYHELLTQTNLSDLQNKVSEGISPEIQAQHQDIAKSVAEVAVERQKAIKRKEVPAPVINDSEVIKQLIRDIDLPKMSTEEIAVALKDNLERQKEALASKNYAKHDELVNEFADLQYQMEDQADELSASAASLIRIGVESTDELAGAIENMTKMYNLTNSSKGSMEIPKSTIDFVKDFISKNDKAPTAEQLANHISTAQKQVFAKDPMAFERWNTYIDEAMSKSENYGLDEEGFIPGVTLDENFDLVANDEQPLDVDQIDVIVTTRSQKHGFESSDQMVRFVQENSFDNAVERFKVANLKELGDEQLAHEASVREAVVFSNYEPKEYYAVEVHFAPGDPNNPVENPDSVIFVPSKTTTNIDNRTVSEMAPKMHRHEEIGQRYSALVDEFLGQDYPGAKSLQNIWNMLMLGSKDGQVKPFQVITKTIPQNDKAKNFVDKAGGIARELYSDPENVKGLARMGVFLVPKDSGGFARIVNSNVLLNMAASADAAYQASQALGFWHTTFSASKLKDPSMRKEAKELARYFNFDGLYDKHVGNVEGVEIYNKEALVAKDEKWQKNILPRLIELEKYFAKDLVKYYQYENGKTVPKQWGNDFYDAGQKLSAVFYDGFALSKDPTGKTRLSIPENGMYSQVKHDNKYANHPLGNQALLFDTAEKLEAMIPELKDPKNHARFCVEKIDGVYYYRTLAAFDGFFHNKPGLKQIFNVSNNVDGGPIGSNGDWKIIGRKAIGDDDQYASKTKGYGLSEKGTSMFKQATHVGSVNEFSQTDTPVWYNLNKMMVDNDIAFVTNPTCYKNSAANEITWTPMYANGNEEYFIGRDASGIPMVKSKIDGEGNQTWEAMISKRDVVKDGTIGHNTVLPADEAGSVFQKEMDYAHEQLDNGVAPQLLLNRLPITGKNGLEFLPGSKEQKNFKGTSMSLLSMPVFHKDHPLMQSPAGQQAFAALTGVAQKVIDHTVNNKIKPLFVLSHALENYSATNKGMYTPEACQMMAKGVMNIIEHFQAEIKTNRTGEHDALSHAEKIDILTQYLHENDDVITFDPAGIYILRAMQSASIIGNLWSSTPMHRTVIADLVRNHLDDAVHVRTAGMTAVLRPATQSKAELSYGLKWQLDQDIADLRGKITDPESIRKKSQELAVKLQRFQDQANQDHIDQESGLWNENSNMITLGRKDVENMNADRKAKGLPPIRIGDKILYGRTPAHGLETTVAGIFGGLSDNTGTISGSPQIIAKLFGADMDLDGIFIKVPDRSFDRKAFDTTWNFLNETGTRHYLFTGDIDVVRKKSKTMVGTNSVLYAKENNLNVVERTHKPQISGLYAETMFGAFIGIGTGLSARNQHATMSQDLVSRFLDPKRGIVKNLQGMGDLGSAVQDFVDTFDFNIVDKMDAMSHASLKYLEGYEGVGPDGKTADASELANQLTAYNVTSLSDPNKTVNIGKEIYKKTKYMKDLIEKGIIVPNSPSSKLLLSLDGLANDQVGILNDGSNVNLLPRGWKGVVAAYNQSRRFAEAFGKIPIKDPLISKQQFEVPSFGRESTDPKRKGQTELMTMNEFLAFVTQDIGSRDMSQVLNNIRRKANPDVEKTVDIVYHTILEYLAKRFSPDVKIDNLGTSEGKQKAQARSQMRRRMEQIENGIPKGVDKDFFFDGLQGALASDSQNKSYSNPYFVLYNTTKLSSFHQKQMKAEILANLTRAFGKDYNFAAELAYGPLPDTVPTYGMKSNAKGFAEDDAYAPVHGSWLNPNFPDLGTVNSAHPSSKRANDFYRHKYAAAFESVEKKYSDNKFKDDTKLGIVESQGFVHPLEMAKAFKDKGMDHGKQIADMYINHAKELGLPKSTAELSASAATVYRDAKSYVYDSAYDIEMKKLKPLALKYGIDLEKGWSHIPMDKLQQFHDEILAPRIGDLVNKLVKDKVWSRDKADEISKTLMMNMAPESMQRFEQDLRGQFGSYLGANVARAMLVYNTFKHLDDMQHNYKSKNKFLNKYMTPFEVFKSNNVQTTINRTSDNHKAYAWDHEMDLNIVMENGVAVSTTVSTLSDLINRNTEIQETGGLFARQVIDLILPAQGLENIKKQTLAMIDEARSLTSEQENSNTFSSDAALLNGHLNPLVSKFLSRIKIGCRSDGFAVENKFVQLDENRPHEFGSSSLLNELYTQFELEHRLPDDPTNTPEDLVNNASVISQSKKAIKAYVEIRKILSPIAQNIKIMELKINRMAERLGYAETVLKENTPTYTNVNGETELRFKDVMIGSTKMARSFESASTQLRDAFQKYDTVDPATVAQMARTLAPGGVNVLRTVYSQQLADLAYGIEQTRLSKYDDLALFDIKYSSPMRKFGQDRVREMLHNDPALGKDEATIKERLRDEFDIAFFGNAQTVGAAFTGVKDQHRQKVADHGKTMPEEQFNAILDASINDVVHTHLNMKKYYDALNALGIEGFKVDWLHLDKGKQRRLSGEAAQIIKQGLDKFVKEKNRAAELVDVNVVSKENLKLGAAYGANDEVMNVYLPMDDILKSVKAENLLLAMDKNLALDSNVFQYNILGIRKNANQDIMAALVNVEAGLRNHFVATGGDNNAIAHNETLGQLQEMLGNKIVYKTNISKNIDSWKQELKTKDRIDLQSADRVSVVYTNNRGQDLHLVGNIIDVWNRDFLFDKYTTDYQLSEKIEAGERKVNPDGTPGELYEGNIMPKVDDDHRVRKEAYITIMNIDDGADAQTTYAIPLDKIKNLTKGEGHGYLNKGYYERYWKAAAPTVAGFSRALANELSMLVEGDRPSSSSKNNKRVSVVYADQYQGNRLRGKDGLGPIRQLDDFDFKIKQNIGGMDKMQMRARNVAEAMVSSFALANYVGAKGISVAIAGIPTFFFNPVLGATMIGAGASSYLGRPLKAFMGNLLSSQSLILRRDASATGTDGSIAGQIVKGAVKGFVAPIAMGHKFITEKFGGQSQTSSTARAHVLHMLEGSMAMGQKFQEVMEQRIARKQNSTLGLDMARNDYRGKALRELANRQKSYQTELFTSLIEPLPDGTWKVGEEEFDYVMEAYKRTVEIAHQQRQELIRTANDYLPENHGWDKIQARLLNGEKPLAGKFDIVPIGEGLLTYDGHTVEDLHDTSAKMWDLAAWWLSMQGTFPKQEITSSSIAYGVVDDYMKKLEDRSHYQQSTHAAEYNPAEKNFYRDELTGVEIERNVEKPKISPEHYYQLEKMLVEKSIGDYNKLMGHKTLAGRMLHIFGAFGHENHMDQTAYFVDRAKMWKAMRAEVEQHSSSAYKLAHDNAMLQIGTWVMQDPMIEAKRQAGVGMMSFSVRKATGYLSRTAMGLMMWQLYSAFFEGDDMNLAKNVLATAGSFPTAVASMVGAYSDLLTMDVGDEDLSTLAGTSKPLTDKSYKKAYEQARRGLAIGIRKMGIGAGAGQIIQTTGDITYVYGKLLWDRLWDAAGGQQKINEEMVADMWYDAMKNCTSFFLPIFGIKDILDIAEKKKKK